MVKRKTFTNPAIRNCTTAPGPYVGNRVSDLTIYDTN